MGGWRVALVAIVLSLLTLLSVPVFAQEERFGDENIAVELFADGPPVAGKTWMLALRFRPKGEEWHGYWSNPGDAGQGMSLDLDLPDGWEIGEPLYPVPQTLMIGGLMNHVYEGEYVVLVPVMVGENVNLTDLDRVTGFVEYLACTDRICVPQDAALTARSDGDFDAWRAQIAPMLDSQAGFEFTGDRLRVAVPLPEELDLQEPHLFVQTEELGNGFRPQYAARQTFIREGNLLVAEMPLSQFEGEGDPVVDTVSGILSFGGGQGVRFEAEPRDVPLEGVKPIAGRTTPDLWQLLLAALAGGLLLNIMPCVFPILSLKALALAKAGGSERSARSDAMTYTAGVVVACAALGAALLLLRSAGQQVGWAFQLQEPVVVMVLLVLASAITANFLGLFEVPGMAISGGAPSKGGSFSTGLLAAFVATPCTGPFMAIALGAALVIPPVDGLLIFVALGVGLALPFLLVGFVPAIRSRLPKPGPWMESFRRWMALPMGLTALALVWLLWRMGGLAFAVGAVAISAVVTLLLAAMLGGLKSTNSRWIAAGLATFFLIGTGMGMQYGLFQSAERSSESIHDPAPFSEAEFADARSSGRPVFVWFTADWCVTCKVNEQVAIEREATRAAFDEAGVISLRGDWTRRDEEISRMLTRQGAAGVPLYLWYAPGGDAEQLPQVLTPDLLVQKAQASQASDTSRSIRPEAGLD